MVFFYITTLIVLLVSLLILFSSTFNNIKLFHQKRYHFVMRYGKKKIEKILMDRLEETSFMGVQNFNIKFIKWILELKLKYLSCVKFLGSLKWDVVCLKKKFNNFIKKNSFYNNLLI